VCVCVPVGPRWLRLPADTGSTQSITKATRKATCTGQADLPHSFILREEKKEEREREEKKREGGGGRRKRSERQEAEEQSKPNILLFSN